MPRLARSEVLFDGPYHIYNRGNNKKDIFLDEDDFQRFITIIRKAKEKFSFHIYHFVVMKNHYHFMIEPNDCNDLESILKFIQQSYSWHWRKKYGYIGHLWQGRFKSIPILDDSYFLVCGAYIELNPVRAGFTRDPSEYRWSSYNTHIRSVRNTFDFIESHQILIDFGENTKERIGKYTRFVESWKTRTPVTEEEILLLQGD